jgi:hypothetical protein
VNSLVRDTDNTASMTPANGLYQATALFSGPLHSFVIRPAWCFNGRMEDVTSLVLRYREAARHIWNCFLRDEPLDAPGLHDWEALKQILFTALVLRNCGHDECAAALLAPDRYGFSWIKPIVHLHVVPLGDVPVMISRDPGPHCRSWDHAVDRVGPNDVDLRFIDFFDWDQMGHIDFRFYLVDIEGSTKYPTLVGHRALLEVAYAKVLAESERPSPGRASG